MSMKSEYLLDQLRGIEVFIRDARLDEARSAINGIRHLLLTESSDEAGKTVARSLSDGELLALAARVRSTQTPGAPLESGAPGRSDFQDRITCWGWYEIQVDRRKRRYRWCGGEREAGLMLPFNPDESSAILIAIRPFDPAGFTRNSIEISINGRPVPVRIVDGSESGLSYLVVEPKSVVTGGFVEVSLHARHGTVPAKVNPESNDQRVLSFNACEFLWLPRD